MLAHQPTFVSVLLSAFLDDYDVSNMWAVCQRLRQQFEIEFNYRAAINVLAVIKPSNQNRWKAMLRYKPFEVVFRKLNTAFTTRGLQPSYLGFSDMPYQSIAPIIQRWPKCNVLRIMGARDRVPLPAMTKLRGLHLTGCAIPTNFIDQWSGVQHLLIVNCIVNVGYIIDSLEVGTLTHLTIKPSNQSIIKKIFDKIGRAHV